MGATASLEQMQLPSDGQLAFWRTPWKRSNKVAETKVHYLKVVFERISTQVRNDTNLTLVLTSAKRNKLPLVQARRIHPLSRIADIDALRSEWPQRALCDRCCTMQISTLRAVCGPSLQVRTNPAETLEADVQATLKLSFTLHRRMTERSPNQPRRKESILHLQHNLGLHVRLRNARQLDPVFCCAVCALRTFIDRAAYLAVKYWPKCLEPPGSSCRQQTDQPQIGLTERAT